MNNKTKLILFISIIVLFTWFVIIPFIKRDSYEETFKKDCNYLFKSSLNHVIIKNYTSIRYKSIPQVYFKDLKSDSVFHLDLFIVEIGRRVNVGDTLIKHKNNGNIYIHKKNRIDTVRFICNMDSLPLKL
jgi:hypothetical protein